MHINDLFQAIDNQDPDQFASYLAPECRFVFGNLPPVTGKHTIREFVDGFFGTIQEISHDIENSWEMANVQICHGTVCYTRKDGSDLTVPFANIMKIAGEGISDYRIFVDVSSL